MTSETISEQPLLVQRDGPVATIVLNRPQRLNALDRAGARRLRELIGVLGDDDEIRAVVLTGSGRAFSAGGDVKDYLLRLLDASPVEREEMFRTYCGIVLDLARLEKPIIAAVNGPAIGGGACLALACDVRFAGPHATFGFVFPQRGLSGADMGATFLLPRIVGLGQAFELLYSGDVIDARAAERIGLVNAVVEGDVLSHAQGFAHRLAAGPPIGHRLTKRALNRWPQLDLAAELEQEAAYQSLCFATEDFREGVRSFQEKRPGRFVGR